MKTDWEIYIDKINEIVKKFDALPTPDELEEKARKNKEELERYEKSKL
jgi:hypothetical protein